MIACRIGLSTQEVVQVFVQTLVVGHGEVSDGLVWISSQEFWVRVVAMSFHLWPSALGGRTSTTAWRSPGSGDYHP